VTCWPRRSRACGLDGVHHNQLPRRRWCSCTTARPGGGARGAYADLVSRDLFPGDHGAGARDLFPGDHGAGARDDDEAGDEGD
jgi:hypothetical protein